jgi:hypothetical protein
VIANNASRAAGAPNPIFTYTLGGAGLVNGDRLSGALATTADRRSGVGAYAIGQGSLAASDNYDLSFAGGLLTVNATATDLARALVPRSYATDTPLQSITGGDSRTLPFTNDGGPCGLLTDPCFGRTVINLGRLVKHTQIRDDKDSFSHDFIPSLLDGRGTACHWHVGHPIGNCRLPAGRR